MARRTYNADYKRHTAAAEELLAQIDNPPKPKSGSKVMGAVHVVVDTEALVARAQVHALLAIAAATQQQAEHNYPVNPVI